MTDKPEPILIEPIGVLITALRKWAEAGGRQPKMFPTHPREAAQYWIDHQMPPDDHKERVREIRSNGKLIAYETPYHDRLVFSLRRFLHLKGVYQTYVIEAAERQIWWRGDRMTIFPKIVEQADKMSKDPASYIEKAQAVLRTFGGRR